ncbi:hydroxymethylglutaryl-CoA reductase, degradative [Lentilactobacillus buchneri]|uniref:3-hydroxy-3-methylglutaryl coenzyme A reductase n=1 Tax=Lentilactobacillus buchneri subsp. silagei CD034 TaxID=1071400 RepID=J9W4W4_LENBU|nr:hydroxymethylglutaryl-CoA reductase, degradative [Lentilactobacillus buchneri]AFS00682.1 3-hydroxy-3-methylglutaryl-CoA reductase [Lentilactobacillus buchneri subsp. silagei CD034]BEJ51877.1 3-hydroxy-3-methylglutaryl coenzyme A reductase [Lentilactobacillus buchneri subsp. silagei]GED93081.1 3-hydroxy-3-methylglutaryl-CoA reductase [Lentilactobacillus buchneri subsp. silagei]GED95367.1 3-hydroxy-3-methylglutaryl-CoA reductase [Lentilactobacillus buchneri subsp. silagei]
MENKWDHFYKKSYEQRLSLIAEAANLSKAQLDLLGRSLNPRSGELIENNLTDYPLPEGIAVGLVVNGHEHLVPMVTEEPSVIAAASNGAKLLSAGAGIHCSVPDNLVSGQVIVKDADPHQVTKFVHDYQQQLIQIADQSHPSVLKYGGGAKGLDVRILSKQFLSVDLLVDTGEAMGANIINTMLEAVSNWLSEQLTVETTMAILTNFADKAIVEVSGKVAMAKLGTKSLSGPQVAQKIADASQIAQLDIRRATTHNKGIMNGVDAAVMAFGNDWRAVESAAHAFAARSGSYQGLSTWEIDEDQLVGRMSLPVPIGFVGGASKVLPLAGINKQIAQIDNSREEMQVVAALGLAQNLAALKALVTDGIQKGHMNLQLRSLALSNGTTMQELPVVVQKLQGMDHPSSQTVKEILKILRR